MSSIILKQLEHLDPFILDQLLQDFQPLFQHRSYTKGALIHQEGHICNHIFLIEKGIARAFYYKDGKDITAHFAAEQTSITAIDSFIQRKQSRYNIEALEDTTAITISHQDIQTLLDNKPQYERYVRLYLEQIYIDLAERIEDLLFHSAKERYQKILSSNPSLLQRVNLGHLASYLGISQETLSRVRAQFS